jgi:hypothetical protein
MVFFELFLSVLINITVVDFDLSESILLWLSGYFLITLVVFCLVGLAYLFFRGGPNLENTYQDKKIK